MTPFWRPANACSVAYEGSCSWFFPGIFREIVVARTGTSQCPVASGIIMAVRVNMRGDAWASMDEAGFISNSEALLASMQARPARSAWQRAWNMTFKAYYHASFTLEHASATSC